MNYVDDDGRDGVELPLSLGMSRRSKIAPQERRVGRPELTTRAPSVGFRRTYRNR